jgi:hypothetical protein
MVVEQAFNVVHGLVIKKNPNLGGFQLLKVVFNIKTMLK